MRGFESHYPTALGCTKGRNSSTVGRCHSLSMVAARSPLAMSEDPRYALTENDNAEANGGHCQGVCLQVLVINCLTSEP